MDTLEESIKPHTNGYSNNQCFIDNTKEDFDLEACRMFQDEDILALNHYYLAWFKQYETTEINIPLKESNSFQK